MAIPLIAAGDIIQIVPETRLFGQTCLNILHYKCRNAPSVGDTYVEQLTQIMTNITTSPGSWYTKMLAAMSEDALVTQLTIQVVFPARRPYVRVGAGGGGGIAADALPPNSTAQITKRSEVAARGRAGHFALPAVPMTKVASGVLLPAYVLTELADLAAALQAPLNYGTFGDYDPVILNVAAPNSSPVILQCDVQQEVRIMRRRTVGLGI
ncbi:MAG TPA: hypothetical protein VJM50_24730 [Pyrinomonadaceae bacterium]|nr:hypothetical protein [Pyrinomonadaceae bacterium]